MSSARRLTSGKYDEAEEAPEVVELFYTVHHEALKGKTLFLVRADSAQEAEEVVKWENSGGKVYCTGQYGISEAADGVVFSCLVPM